MKIHQLLSGFADGDATSQEAILLRDLVRKWGHASDIFADPSCISPTLSRDCRPLSDYHAAPDDICLHHYGIASPAVDCFLASPARKILIYHNITPADHFIGFDDELVLRLRQARDALPNLARQVDAVWAVSRFNATELTALGIQNVKVFPLLFSPALLNLPPDPRILHKFSGPLQNILFVGRNAPNKRIENLIEAFAWYNKSINPYSRLIIVGSGRSTPRYYLMLRMLVGDLDLPNVCFEGFASAEGLVAYYKVAHAYVCPSEHEGYCMPLIEAMYMGVPVIARATGGMPEAINGAGVLYDQLEALPLAELIHRVLTDAQLRKEILASQEKRMRQILERKPEAELEILLAEFLTRK